MASPAPDECDFGITTDYGEMTFADPRSGAMLFGVVRVTALANVLHLVLGVAGLAAAGPGTAARWYLLIGGAVSFVLWMSSLTIHPLDAQSSRSARVTDGSTSR